MRHRSFVAYRDRRPQPLFSGQEMMRLILLVSMLVLVLAIMNHLRRPDSMEWLMGMSWDEPKDRAASGPAGGKERSDATESAGGDFNPLGLQQVDELREVNELLLKDVQDRLPVRTEEQDAVYQLLGVAATTRPEQLARKARRDVLYANLFHEPDTYRGQPIHVRGVLARLEQWEKKALKNAYGIDTYYAGWIFPEDQPDNPVVVLFTSLPDGLPIGDQLKENVAADAYFFKLFAYQARDGKVHAVPMLAGFRPHWSRPEDSGLGVGAAIAIAALASVLILGVGAVWWSMRRDERLAAKLHAASVPRDAAAVISFLDQNPAEPEGSNSEKSERGSGP